MSDLNVVAWGAGEPVVLVHGSFGWGTESWAWQQPLAERYRLLLLDRRGFGRSAPGEREDFQVDAADIAEVLGDGAHLVRHSYGGLGCLLAAARRPEAVWSLTLIEPAAFGVARGDQAVERLIGRLQSLFARATDTTPDDFYVDFLLTVMSPADQLPAVQRFACWGEIVSRAWVPITVLVPHALLPFSMDEVGQLTAVRVPGRRGVGGLVSRFLMQSARQVDQHQAPDAMRLSKAAPDVPAALLAHQLDRRSAAPPQTHRQALLQRIHVFIDQHLGDPELSPGMVATANHISVRYLHKLFQEHDMTVAAWIPQSPPGPLPA
jgi:pimeloyl-ACP methyl ester carboxylesterase